MEQERLSRTVRVAESSEGPHEHQVMYAVEGMAGAVSLSVVGGNFRSTGESHEHGPVGIVSDPLMMLSCELVSGGLFAHAFRPWPGEPRQDWEECNMLPGGRCHTLDLDGGPSLLISTPMVIRLVQPGGLDETWEKLEELYREVFVPALSPRANAIEAARFAEARADGAARAAGPPPPDSPGMPPLAPGTTGQLADLDDPRR